MDFLDREELLREVQRITPEAEVASGLHAKMLMGVRTNEILAEVGVEDWCVRQLPSGAFRLEPEKLRVRLEEELSRRDAKERAETRLWAIERLSDLWSDHRVLCLPRVGWGP